MKLQQINLTGSRIIGSITGLGKVGPKHHAIVLGTNTDNGNVIVAESMHNEYRFTTYNDFIDKYSLNGNINVIPNNGKYSNLQVAKRALKEILDGGKGAYNLFTNNCESFSNRAMYNKSSSKQVIHTAIGVTMAVGLIWMLKDTKPSVIA